MSLVRPHIWPFTCTSAVTNTVTDFFLKFEAFPKITSAGPILFCSGDLKWNWLCTGGTQRPCSCRQPRYNDKFARSKVICTLQPRKSAPATRSVLSVHDWPLRLNWKNVRTCQWQGATELTVP